MYDIDAKQEGVYQRCYEEQKEEITALRAQVSALQTEAKHWRDQHANEVKRAKIIKGTGDVPLQRIQAYERMGELQGQVAELKAANDELNAECCRLSHAEEKATEKGAESMRKRAAQAADDCHGEASTCGDIIAALPLKENEG